jgi:hypothetical protein
MRMFFSSVLGAPTSSSAGATIQTAVRLGVSKEHPADEDVGAPRFRCEHIGTALFVMSNTIAGRWITFEKKVKGDTEN